MKKVTFGHVRHFTKMDFSLRRNPADRDGFWVMVIYMLKPVVGPCLQIRGDKKIIKFAINLFFCYNGISCFDYEHLK
jgi:hypothetical protein